MSQLPSFRPGQALTADALTELYRRAAALEIKVAAPLVKSGNCLGVDLSGGGFWAKLTAQSGASFAWTEQYRPSAGTWADGARSGTTSADPAAEWNGSTATVTLPYRVRAWRDAVSGEVLFQLGACS